MNPRSLSAIIAALICVAFTITTCKGSGEEIEKNVKVTGVELNKSSLTLAEGASETLTATISPIDATNVKVTWSSSEPSVAIVSGGTVSAIKAGNTVITVKTTDGSKTATCNVTVTAPVPPFVAVTAITGVPTSATAGTPLTLTGTVEPSEATNKTITWSVANAGTTGATISGNTLNTTAAGTVTVKATIVNGATATTNFTKDFSITVNAAFIAVTGITGVPTTATAGTPLTLTGTVEPSNATNKTITWSVASAGTTGATISGSTLNTTAAGTVTVKATVVNGATATTNYTKDFNITVSAAFVAVTSITGVPTTATAGTPLTLTGTVEPSNATNKTITWSVASAGTTGATISGSTLNITAAGTVTVKATIVNGATATTNYTKDFNITVSAAFVAVTNITGVPTTATAGTPLTLTGTVEPSNATNKTITWSVASAGTTGATISGNTLNTTAAGTVTVKATVVNGTTATTNYTKDFNITVSAAFVAVTSITGVPTTATAGTALTLTGTVNPSNATNKTITWSVASAGTTGATISGSTLNTTAAGTVSVRATILNGKTATTNYTQDFSITVAAASFFSGKGTSTDPYLIKNAADLSTMRDLINNYTPGYNGVGIYYRQTDNINLGVAPYNSGNGWTPIGPNVSNHFSATYDGRGYQIAGLTISGSSINPIGLFAQVDGVVRNIALTGVNINMSGTYGVGFGGLAGNNYGKIEFCYVTGSISGWGFGGGVTGGNMDNGTVENCYTTCSITNSNGYAGGIVGSNYGTVRKCYATGAISGSATAGGIVGYNYTTLSTTSYCFALNVSVNRTPGSTSTSFGRVVGSNAGTLSYNYGLDIMNTNSGVTFVNGHTGKDGGIIGKEEAKMQKYYEDRLNLGFGTTDNSPWKMGLGTYKLPVFYWQTTAPEMPAHLN